MPTSQTKQMTDGSGVTSAPPIRNQHRRIERLDRMARALDSRFRIPGVGIMVGWDAILGLIPGLGAAVTLGPGVITIVEASRMGGRKRTMMRMAGNTAIDMVVGAIPVFGDIFDLFFKSNRRNVELLKSEYAYLVEKRQPRPRHRPQLA